MTPDINQLLSGLRAKVEAAQIIAQQKERNALGLVTAARQIGVGEAYANVVKWIDELFPELLTNETCDFVGETSDGWTGRCKREAGHKGLHVRSLPFGTLPPPYLNRDLSKIGLSEAVASNSLNVSK